VAVLAKRLNGGASRRSRIARKSCPIYQGLGETKRIEDFIADVERRVVTYEGR